jgi:hypothetical protein
MADVTELWAELSKERPDGIIEIGVVLLKDDDEPKVDLHPELIDAEDEEQLRRAFSIGDIHTGRYVGYGEGEEPKTETTYKRLSEPWFDHVLKTLPKPYRGERIPPPGSRLRQAVAFLIPWASA